MKTSERLFVFDTRTRLTRHLQKATSSRRNTPYRSPTQQTQRKALLWCNP
ncbi:hypothetical protein BaRGS_00027251 [Batillaria attramentaria]|uniref:Uncharacterized protein n=1 Tax=Batillaria attramentaria TaxID=370345 RepID=A0ABD0K2M0_9CAEN